MMRSDLVVSLLAGVALILLVLLPCWLWLRRKTTPATPTSIRTQREPTPFAGCTHKPACALCDWESASHSPAPSAPPSQMTCTRGRRRHVETTGHVCPHAQGAYHGWVDWGHIRANGHPNGRRWRQRHCLDCHGSCLETLGTPFHAKQVDPDKLVWAITALAEGLGMRAVARVFATAPHTVVRWLGEGAAHLEAFSRYVLREVYVEQVQMDALFALRSAVTDGDGEVTEAQAKGGTLAVMSTLQ